MPIGSRGTSIETNSVEIPADSGSIALSVEWLRDNCRCAECWPTGGQRRRELWAAPEPTLVSVHVEAGLLTVEFGPDGHISTFPLEQLASICTAGEPDARDGDLTSSEWHQFDDVDHGGDGLVAFLSDVDRNGLGLLRGVPCEEGVVAQVAELFSPVLVTNYGWIFDVRVERAPANLAFSDRGLGLHTDNPYREPVPPLQLLHCLAAGTQGGGSRFVDGIAVARRLRESAPDAFELLASTAVAFAYEDAASSISTRAPIIELDTAGAVRAIRHNTRSIRPDPIPADLSSAWYGAYRRFAQALEEDASVRELTLAPGELVCFDNRRVLHGRAAFQDGGDHRHLQGCYAAMDALRSYLAVARRPSERSVPTVRER